MRPIEHVPPHQVHQRWRRQRQDVPLDGRIGAGAARRQRDTGRHHRHHLYRESRRRVARTGTRTLVGERPSALGGTHRGIADRHRPQRLRAALEALCVRAWPLAASQRDEHRRQRSILQSGAGPRTRPATGTANERAVRASGPPRAQCAAMAGHCQEHRRHRPRERHRRDSSARNGNDQREDALGVLRHGAGRRSHRRTQAARGGDA